MLSQTSELHNYAVTNPDLFRLEWENGKVSDKEGRLFLVVLLSALNENIIWIVYTLSM